jgi:hypothetical protein
MDRTQEKMSTLLQSGDGQLAKQFAAASKALGFLALR